MNTLHTHVKQMIKGYIRSGKYAVNSVLPPVDELAGIARCSPDTVRRAMKELAREGLLQGVRRRGTVVLRQASAGSVCLLLAEDEHLNLLLQNEMSKALVGAGFDVEVVPYLDGVASMRAWCERVARRHGRLDGLVALAPEKYPEAGRAEADALLGLFEQRVYVQVDAGDVHALPPGRRVAVDQQRAARLVVDHLLALGHRKAAFFAGHLPGERSSNCAVTASFCRHLMQVAGGEARVYHGMDGLDRLAQWMRHDGVTAFWDLNDATAMRTLRHLERTGLRVPEDVTLVGRNDSPWAMHTQPNLSSVSLNPAGLAAAAVRALQGGAAEDVYLVDPLLVARESSGPAAPPRSRKDGA